MDNGPCIQTILKSMGLFSIDIGGFWIRALLLAWAITSNIHYKCHLLKNMPCLGDLDRGAPWWNGFVQTFPGDASHATNSRRYWISCELQGPSVFALINFEIIFAQRSKTWWLRRRSKSRLNPFKDHILTHCIEPCHTNTIMLFSLPLLVIQNTQKDHY